MELKLTDIRIDGGTQSRQEIDLRTRLEYAEAMSEGAKFPPVVTFFDGKWHWLADGFHRYFAADHLNLKTIDAEVRKGTVRDAILYSAGANRGHGLRRTNADKRAAVTMLLRDEEWGKKSDRWIAEACGVSDRFVNGIRAEVEPTANGSQSRLGRDGKERRLPTPPPPPVEPDEPADDEGEEPSEPVEPIRELRAEKPAARLGQPSNGMQFAKLAVMQLEQIRSDDTERKGAFSYVREWINENEG